MTPNYKRQLDRPQALEIIAECANLGLWEIFQTDAGFFMHMDATASAIFQLPSQEHTLSISHLGESCKAEDRPRIRAEMHKLFARPEQTAMIEFRIWNPSAKQWRWVRNFAKSQLSEMTQQTYLLGSVQDIQDSLAFQSYVDQMNEANDRVQIMLDATPLCCNFWDEHFNNIDCNQEAATLFDLPSKQAYLDNFAGLSPEYQPDGERSSDKALAYIKEAFQNGKVIFEWMHQKLNGERIPSEITLVRVKRADGDIVVGYTRDLREYKRMLAAMQEANQRAKIMLDATPLCCNFWDENLNNIDCNQEAANLFDLPDKQSYLDNFPSLSPIHQPDGEKSSEKSLKYIREAFVNGKVTFEWMHQKLNGELIPSEVTLVRVKRSEGFNVVGYTRDLREYKKMMTAMQEANERTQIMLDATPLCCNFWDENFNNIDCNQEAATLFDLPSKKAYLDNFGKLSPKYQPDGELSSEKALKYIREAFASGKVVFEWMHQKLSGELIPAEITLVRVNRIDGDIVVGYTRDLREYKRMSAATQEANERTQIMLDATPLCCNLWDENLNNIDCNAEAVNLFDLENKQQYLDRFFELSPKYQPCGRLSADMAQEYIHKAFRDGGVRFEWMHQKLSGEQIPSEITLVRVKRGDTHIVAGYTRDMREHKKIMQEIRQVEADLRLARDAAEESARSKSEFLANMSHEIRTPMNAILGMLHLIQSDSTENLSAKQSDYLNTIEQSAKTLLRIINDILDFSKIEANRLEMENVPFSLSDVLQQAHNLFDQSIQSKGLSFEIITPESLDTGLIGDPLRLTQILMNFMSNAIKFTEKGGIILSVSETRSAKDQALFRFCVEDTGVGMSEDQIARLFNPFTQADTSTTRKYGGTGLGLVISKRLVHLMNGDIWCESNPGKGSKFCMSATFQLSSAHEVPTESAASSGCQDADQSAEYIQNLKPVLLAEDNEINQMIAKELLTIKGYKVDIASNGQEAIDMLLAGDYSLVLMDIQMPIMDGLTATQKIRQMDRFQSLPILAMTAHAMSGDFEKSLSVGMNDHITKPIQPDILYQTLEKWTKNQPDA